MPKLPKLSKSKKIILLVIIFSFLIFGVASCVRAAFVEDAGFSVSSQPEDSMWYKAAQSVNAPDGMDLIPWTGWAINGLEFHIIAAANGYPEEDGTIPRHAYQKGIIGKTAGLIHTLNDIKPASSTEYFAYLGRNLNLTVTKPVYAQGKGWTFLENPVLNLWKITRNVAYLFFVIVFVIVGFMVMFRTKIDPQTAISIQTALPKVIIALILVTFSYAIAGLLIDLAYVGNRLIDSVVLDQQPIKDYVALRGKSPKIDQAPVGPGAPPKHTWDQARRVESVDPFDMINFYLGGGVTNLKDLLTSNLTLGLIFTVVVLTAAIRIFLALLGRYVTLIISTIFAPFVFLWGSLPGQEEHISKWIRGFLAAVFTFPAMYLLLNLASYFLVASNAFAMELKAIEPLDLSTSAVSLGAKVPVAGQLLAIGIILMLPSLPSIIDDALAVKPPIAGEQIGACIGGVLKIVPVVGTFVS